MGNEIVFKRIGWETLVQYWKDVDHFQDPNKRYNQHINRLGPYHTPYKNPRKINYGLYDDDQLIGATQLVEWQENIVRYRTVNVLNKYRGQDLGWRLLYSAWASDWTEYTHLLGWVRNNHMPWAVNHGFKPYGDIQEDHIMMIREMKDVK